MKTIAQIQNEKEIALELYPKKGKLSDKNKADREIQFYDFLIKYLTDSPDEIDAKKQLNFSNKKMEIINKNIKLLNERDDLTEDQLKEEISQYKTQMEFQKLKKQIKTLNYLLN